MDLSFNPVELILHIDKHLQEVVNFCGPWTYVILFLVIFCETGLVVTPFLPGDSLLFAIGALAGISVLDIKIVIPLLFVAAVVGDAVNYSIGRYLGPAAFDHPKLKPFLKPQYLRKTEEFYERYGGKAIVIARFVPIVRTLAPFLAGVGKMNYKKFSFYNISGGAVWVLSLTIAGYLFGELPIVKNNFGLVVIGIIIVSVMPAVFEYIKASREARTA
ncbi:DedA family protein [bacterium]|nr:DedA family protein [bacterium]